MISKQDKIQKQHDVVAYLNEDLNNCRFGTESYNHLLKLIVKEIGQDTVVKSPVYFDTGNVSFGKHCFINRDCKFIDFGGITLGDNVGVSMNVTFVANNHPENPLCLDQWVDLPVPVCVEDDVWIGANVTIIGPVKIGKGSIIGAGSVVTKDVPSGVVVAGNPAKVIETVAEYRQKHGGNIL